jgi:hypothetical protein
MIRLEWDQIIIHFVFGACMMLTRRRLTVVLFRIIDFHFITDKMNITISYIILI